MESTVGIRLVKARFSRLSAELGTNDDASGGKLNVQITNEIKKGSDDLSARGEITIDVLALPKESRNEKDFSFRLSVKVAGIFEWDKSTTPPDLKSESIRQSLSLSLYVMGVSEIHALTTKLGFHNVNIPWDIKTLVEISVQNKIKDLQSSLKTKKTIKPPAKKKVIKKVLTKKS